MYSTVIGVEMALPRLNKRLVLLGTIALAAATIAIAWSLLSEAPPSEESTTEETTTRKLPLDSWKATTEASAVQISLERGPTLRLDETTTVSLAPLGDDLTISEWTHERSQDQHQLIGTGTLGRARARVVWTITEGNPQAHLSIAVEQLPSSRLAEPIVLQLPFTDGKTGTQRILSELPPATNPTLSWQHGDHRLTFSGWSGDAAHARASVDGLPTLEFSLWLPQRHPGAQSCEQAPAESKIDMSAELTMTIGGAPTALGWPYPRGFDATLAPVFDTPTAHPDPQLEAGAAEDAASWLRRARTLVYGHSNPTDPRYGNGGLLGHGLGGTLVVPEAFAADEEVRAFAQDLAATRVGLAVRGAPKEELPSAIRLLGEPSCAALVQAAEAGDSAVIVDTRELPAGELLTTTDSLPSPYSGSIAASYTPFQFNGRSEALLAGPLDTRHLDVLLDERATAVFSAPFVATRNPLIAAAKDALLEPERNGHWTVAADFASALADIELWREASPLLITSLHGLASHGSAVRQVAVWRAEDGGLVVHNPSDELVRGFTLAVPGPAEISVDGESPAGQRRVSAGEKETVTLFWWDLAPGLQRVAVTVDGETISGPAAVTWRVGEEG